MALGRAVRKWILRGRRLYYSTALHGSAIGKCWIDVGVRRKPPMTSGFGGLRPMRDGAVIHMGCDGPSTGRSTEKRSRRLPWPTDSVRSW